MKITRYLFLAFIMLISVCLEAAERVVVTFPLSFGLVYIMGISDKIVGIPTQKLGIKEKAKDLKKYIL